jgi:hypothetical protein
MFSGKTRKQVLIDCPEQMTLDKHSRLFRRRISDGVKNLMALTVGHFRERAEEQNFRRQKWRVD